MDDQLLTNVLRRFLSETDGSVFTRLGPLFLQIDGYVDISEDEYEVLRKLVSVPAESDSQP